MTKDSRNLLWIIGEGGLLGSSLRSRSRVHQDLFTLWSPNCSFSWNHPQTLIEEFQKHLKTFRSMAQQVQSWTIMWTAGAGIIGSAQSNLIRETENFTFFLRELENCFMGNLTGGHFFLSSSAGGIWAGAQRFPITENTPPLPISDYGRQKLKQEEELTRLANLHPEFKVLIGRISNLYGSGQNLSKPQGLLSQLCRSTLLKVPLNIFVPLDTVRDYIFTEDCSELIFRALKKHHSLEFTNNIMLKIFASEEPASIRVILNYLHRLTRREPVITLPAQSATIQHPKELSFQSTVLIDSYHCKPLIEGLKQLLDYQESLFQMGELPFPEAS